MAKMKKAKFAAALQEWADKVIQAQADDKCTDETGRGYSYDTERMIKEVTELIADGFDRHPPVFKA